MCIWIPGYWELARPLYKLIAETQQAQTDKLVWSLSWNIPLAKASHVAGTRIQQQGRHPARVYQEAKQSPSDQILHLLDRENCSHGGGEEEGMDFVEQ